MNAYLYHGYKIDEFLREDFLRKDIRHLKVLDDLINFYSYFYTRRLVISHKRFRIAMN